MANFIRHRAQRTNTHFSRSFGWRTDPNAGFLFDSDEKGNVLKDRLKPAALENYNKCISGEYDIVDQGVMTFTNNWTEPAVIECDFCETHVELHGFTNTCEKCETDYNMSGQRLAAREVWGEETREHWSDISRIR